MVASAWVRIVVRPGLLVALLLASPMAHAQEAGAPDAPAELTCTAYEWGIELSWTEVEASDRYKIYRSLASESDFALRHFTTATSWTDSSVEPDAAYRYQVVSVNGAGESEPVECQAVAVPFFPLAFVGALALMGAVGAYAWARRRHHRE